MKKSMERRLQNSPKGPRRPLSADFTKTLLGKIDERAHKPEHRPKWKEYIQVKLIHKPAFAAAAFVVALTIGGSAYAAVGGINGVRTILGSETATNNGDRIVRVDAKNCPRINVFNTADGTHTTDDSYYYRINGNSKPINSKLTDAQVIDIVQRYCAFDAESYGNKTLANAVRELPENKNKLVGGYVDSVITAISPSSISIHSVIPRYGSEGTTPYTFDQTFTQIDPKVTVTSKGATENYNSLKVGDHVGIVYRATGDALTQAATTLPDQVDTSAQTVVIITRVSEDITRRSDFTDHNHIEFEQVTQCDSNPSGYCSLDEYQSHKH